MRTVCSWYFSPKQAHNGIAASVTWTSRLGIEEAASFVHGHGEMVFIFIFFLGSEALRNRLAQRGALALKALFCPSAKRIGGEYHST